MSAGKFLLGVAIGGAVGVAVALAVAPRAGTETREGLRRRAGDMPATMGEVTERARRLIAAVRQRFERAMAAARDAAVERRRDLEAKFAAAKARGEMPRA